MKKLTTGLFVVALGFGLVACNNQEENVPATTEQSETVAPAVEPTAPAAEEGNTLENPALNAEPVAPQTEEVAPVEVAPVEEAPVVEETPAQ